VEDFQASLDHPDLWHPNRGFRVVAEWVILPWMRQAYQLVAERYVPGRTVVVASAMAFGARIAQEKLGVPLATAHLQPSMLYSKHAPPDLAPTVAHPWLFPRWVRRFVFWLGYRFVIDPILAPRTNAFRAELGLPPVVRGFLDRWAHSPQCVLGLFPEWFGPPQPDWPPNVTLTSFPLFDERGLAELAPEVETFLAAGEPPVVFTPGSANKHSKAFFSAAVEACGKLGRRGVLLTRFADQLPPRLPAGTRHFEYVPFSQVFARAAAVVHHGGVGTMAQALAAGVPQLVMPLAHDQPDNAARARRLGVGRAILPKAFRGPVVAKALAELIGSPEVAARCRAVAEKLRGADAIGPACRAIEALVEPARATAGV
jgi:UDP:flavonoid glycosyltransferase YjiC (YdhE family)